MESVLGVFPDRQLEIEQLYLESKNFQEMCTDFEEAHCLLANWTSPTELSPAVIDEFQTLLKDLEAEMLEALDSQRQSAKVRGQNNVT